MAAQMTPMVAAVPKEVPVRTDTRQLSRKAIITNRAGWMSRAEKQTITGMVPACRHRAVSIPMSTKVMRMFFTVRMPSRARRNSRDQAKPFRRP